MIYEVKCDFCGQPVDAQSKETWHRVEGWERPGKAGGSDIALRRRPAVGLFAHDHCVRLERGKLQATQEAML